MKKKYAYILLAFISMHVINRIVHMRRTSTNTSFFRLISVTILLAVLVAGVWYVSGDDAGSINASAETDVKEPAAEKIFRSIKGKEAQSLMETKDDLLVIDVRTPQERKQVRLAGSQLVPIGDVMRGRLKVPKEQPLLVICAVGGRSYIVSKTLIAMGHREIYNLDGGIEAWWRAGLPVETGAEHN